MTLPPPTSGFQFPGLNNLRNDLYPAISAAQTPSLHQPGKVVLITGAGRGIGRSIALQYATAGVAAVVLCARTTSELDEVEARIKEINADVKVHKFSTDVTNEEAVANVAKQVQEAEGRLDVLVNNAGYTEPWLPLGDANPSTWWRALEVNLKGPFLFTHAFLPLLQATAQQTGAPVNIVNMSSIGANIVQPTSSGYNTSKIALNRLSEFVHVEYGAKGLIVNALNPGGVLTELSKDVDVIRPYLNDSPDLAGGFVVWLTAEAREWLAGRYLSSTWDVDRLLEMREEIVEGDKLKTRLVI